MAPTAGTGGNPYDTPGSPGGQSPDAIIRNGELYVGGIHQGNVSDILARMSASKNDALPPQSISTAHREWSRRIAAHTGGPEPSTSFREVAERRGLPLSNPYSAGAHAGSSTQATAVAGGPAAQNERAYVRAHHQPRPKGPAVK
ncbi:hypothetical protein [Jidongwangia harbinensis]|uniref:hypothetical protein n=1 Tax=Jidongwangia harbinensis TaxID=2878561 RepID=UPI001CD9571A|nr:hypothetical protein [Jidongwangia harbinensis]MCA2214135.1 hypothetical protein [Jidongwangia harbinensis]